MGVSHSTRHHCTAQDSMVDFKIDLKRIWRFHSDRGGEFFKECDAWLRENIVAHTTTEGYDPQAVTLQGLFGKTGVLEILPDGSPTTSDDRRRR